jgi:hypothetical protein
MYAFGELIVVDPEAFVPYGSHNEDEEYCRFCQKIYQRTNAQSGSAYAFCGGCGVQLTYQNREHMCSERLKLRLHMTAGINAGWPNWEELND